MKRINIWYWILTGLIAAYMIFTAIPNVMVDDNSVNMINGMLGYPKYFIPFIGVAKILGSIALLIPGLKLVKPWAYAGLLFDLVGATYSIVAIGGLNYQIIFMILPIIVLFISYYLWLKRTGQA